jgi:Double zinc ribbon
MRPTECSFCQHANPPDAKFCNACGAPLYLLPCPHCGAVNDATATVCHQCAGKLQGRATRTATPPSGARKVAAGGAAASGGGVPDRAPPESQADALERDAHVAATLQHLRQLLEPSDPEPVAKATAEAIPDPPSPDQDRKAVAVRPDAPAAYPVSAVEEPRAFRAEPRAARRGRRALVVGAVLLGCLVAAYFFYLGMAPLPADGVAGNADAGGSSAVATGAVVGARGGPVIEAPAKSTPTTTPLPAAAASTPATEVPVVRPGTARPDDRRAPETAPLAGPSGETQGQRRSGEDAKDSTPRAPAVVPATVARPRTIDAGAGFELQQPRVGPCTEVVAALGLCTREPAQGRE